MNTIEELFGDHGIHDIAPAPAKTASRVIFEACGQYVTALSDDGVLVRCLSDNTDLRNTEPLDGFVARHGGLAGVTDYLKECHAQA